MSAQNKKRFFKLFDIGAVVLFLSISFYFGDRARSLDVTEKRVDSLETDYRALLVQVHDNQVKMINEMSDIKGDLKVLKQRR